ncbi:hypothetical protein AJ87_13950 [Rhizobium yanglingense]|nr:hypothetical protein AJ87_13950 [Rhizobium yanglingense]
MAPIEPSVPPPMMRKLISIGATVWPLVTNQVAPRQTRSPPRVTMKDGTFKKAMIMPWSMPIDPPTMRPAASVMIQVAGLLKPRYCGSTCACKTPITMPQKPSMEPTERSMLRVTITSTMPVAMTATDEVWTERFQRLRGVRKRPPVMIWKPIQMISSAPTMPRSRVSISVARKKRATGLASALRGPLEVVECTVSAMGLPFPHRLGRPRRFSWSTAATYAQFLNYHHHRSLQIRSQRP